MGAWIGFALLIGWFAAIVYLMVVIPLYAWWRGEPGWWWGCHNQPHDDA